MKTPRYAQALAARSHRIAAAETLADRIANQGILPAGQGAKHGDIEFANAARLTEAYFSEPLTAYAVGWRDPNNIEATCDFFAPPVAVNRRFEYAEAVNAEEFLSETDDVRAIGSDFKRVEFKSTKTTAKTQNKGLSICVDLDEVADKQGWEQNYTAKLLRRLLRNELRRAVALLSAAATNNAKTWDTTAGKDPDQDVRSDLLAASTASGIRPNRVGYGDTAWDKRGLSHRAQNTAGGYASAALTPDQLAALLMVDRVLVSRERYQATAAAKAEIVNNLVLEFFAADNLDPEDPSNIKRFWTPAEGGGRWRIYSQQISSKLYVITVEHYSLIKVTSTLGLRKLTIS
jgi:hypothetical protein